MLAVYDVVYIRGDLWTSLDSIHGFTATAAALMTALAIVGLIYRTTRQQFWVLNWEMLLLLLVYAGSMNVVYRA